MLRAESALDIADDNPGGLYAEFSETHQVRFNLAHQSIQGSEEDPRNRDQETQDRKHHHAPDTVRREIQGDGCSDESNEAENRRLNCFTDDQYRKCEIFRGGLDKLRRLVLRELKPRSAFDLG